MNPRRITAMTGLAGLSLAVWCGCGSDVRLAGKKLRHNQVQAVSHFGINLDQSATPEQAAAVALRAIREDFLATGRAEREAALDVQFDVAAVGAIASRNKTSLSRDEYIHHVVSRWTPTVSHYARDFEMDIDKGLARLKNRGMSKPAAGDVLECELAMEVTDPTGDQAARSVMLIWLAKDGGFWRVTHFGFEPKRALAGAAAGAPTGRS